MRFAARLVVFIAVSGFLGCSWVPATAITPIMPISVDQDANSQIEHAQTSLDELYKTAGVDRAKIGIGVKVGVIDSGIAVYPKGYGGGPAGFELKTNACFDDKDYPKTTQLGDTRFTNNKVISARVFWYPAQNRITPEGIDQVPATAEAVAPHGSHVAGIIGCNANTRSYINGGSVGTISGIAPRVLLGSYNVFPGPEDVPIGPSLELISKAIDAAVADSMDIINLSLGSTANSANRILNDAVDRAFNAGVLVVVSAGNSGPDEGTIATPANSPNALTVGSVDGGRELITTLTVDGKKFRGPVGRIGIPVRPVSGLLAVAGTKESPSTACQPEDLGQEVEGKIAIVNRGDCHFYDKLVNLRKAGAVGAIIVSQPGTEPAALSSNNEEIVNIASLMVTYTEGQALIEAARLHKVGAFSSPTLVRDKNPGRMSIFSSSGPAPITNYMKPDLVAPGSNILSAATGTLSDNCASTGRCFILMSGTSMAAPYVTGVAALLKYLHPTWDAVQLRSALIHTANPTKIASIGKTSPYRSGLGLVDPMAANRAKFGLDVTTLLSPNNSHLNLNLASFSSIRQPLIVTSSEPWLTGPTSIQLYSKRRAAYPLTIAKDAPDGAVGYLTFRVNKSGVSETTMRVAIRVGKSDS